MWFVFYTSIFARVRATVKESNIWLLFINVCIFFVRLVCAKNNLYQEKEKMKKQNDIIQERQTETEKKRKKKEIGERKNRYRGGTSDATTSSPLIELVFMMLLYEFLDASSHLYKRICPSVCP